MKLQRFTEHHRRKMCLTPQTSRKRVCFVNGYEPGLCVPCQNLSHGCVGRPQLVWSTPVHGGRSRGTLWRVIQMRQSFRLFTPRTVESPRNYQRIESYCVADSVARKRKTCQAKGVFRVL